MQDNFIIKSKNFDKKDKNDLKSIEEIFNNNEDLSGNSLRIVEYEKELSLKFNKKYSVAVSSGTSAIYLALISLNLKKDDEIIIPVTAATMSAIPALMLNLKIVFVDSSKNNTFEIDIDDLKRKITSKTKAIISVGMWGYCGYSKELESFAKSKKIPIIEDSAQSLGAINDSGHEGCCGLIGCFSTHELKLISTGEGGFILTNNQKIYEKIKSFSKVGFVDKKGYGEELGLNLKGNTISAVLGINQLKKLDQKIKKRRENIALWKKLLSSNNNLISLDNFYGNKFIESGYSVCFINNSLNFNSKIFAENLHNLGVSTDVYRYKYQILPEYKIFKKFKNSEFLNAEKFISKLIVLPTHETLKKENIEKASEIILRLLKEF